MHIPLEQAQYINQQFPLRSKLVCSFKIHAKLSIYITLFSAKVHGQPHIYHSNSSALFMFSIFIQKMQTSLETNSVFTTVLRDRENLP